MLVTNEAGGIAGTAAPSRCLVADIGGTNARFAVAEVAAAQAAPQRAVLAHARNFLVREHPSLSQAMDVYLAALPPAERPNHAVLAVASAVTSDAISFTNSHWSFSIRALRAALGLERLLVANDFAAAAWAVPILGSGDLVAVGPCVARDDGGSGMRVVLGPGTGLGLAALRSEADGRASVIETEGGHISLAPRNADEMFILEFLARRYGRVSYERVLAGDGWLNLYQAWSDRLGLQALHQTPEQVSEAGRRGDPAARAATRTMAAMLGAFAGDAVLVYGAWQGVYLAGGLLQHLLDGETAEVFHASFIDKGRFAALLSKTPVLRIVNPDLGNLGAAVLAANWLARKVSL
jgi:glucokinase